MIINYIINIILVHLHNFSITDSSSSSILSMHNFIVANLSLFNQSVYVLAYLNRSYDHRQNAPFIYTIYI